MLFLSMHSDPVYVREAFRAGANGYLLKRTAVSELRNAITAIMEGRVYVSPQVTNKNVDELLAAPAAGSFGSDLTARQRQVLQLVAEGKTAKEIAATLNISTKTVEFHKTSIMDALGMRTIAQLTRYALDHKIVGV
ncbi:MAG: response regulator transcription factor [Acidobacteriaceae bacterium]|nr:response regulator transcription factor [Acidobacteriaceae bacterium]